MRARNAYGLWFEHGKREIWVRKVTWGRYVARLISMNPPKGPPPYYGNCGFVYEIHGPGGLVTDWPEITTWGSYAWVLAGGPEAGNLSPGDV